MRLSSEMLWRMLLRQREAQRQQLKPPRNSDDDTNAAHPATSSTSQQPSSDHLTRSSLTISTDVRRHYHPTRVQSSTVFFTLSARAASRHLALLLAAEEHGARSCSQLRAKIAPHNLARTTVLIVDL